MKNVFIRVSIFNTVYFLVGAAIIYILGLSPYFLAPLAVVILFWAYYSYKMNIQALEKADELGMEGKRAIVVETIDPYGTVKIGNEYWKAYADTPIVEGTNVKVIRSEGLTLVVGAVNNSSID